MFRSSPLGTTIVTALSLALTSPAAAIFGSRDYNDCSSDEIGFNEDSLRHARIVVASTAFEECVGAALNGGAFVDTVIRGV